MFCSLMRYVYNIKRLTWFQKIWRQTTFIISWHINIPHLNIETVCNSNWQFPTKFPVKNKMLCHYPFAARPTGLIDQRGCVFYIWICQQNKASLSKLKRTPPHPSIISLVLRSQPTELFDPAVLICDKPQHPTPPPSHPHLHPHPSFSHPLLSPCQQWIKERKKRRALAWKEAVLARSHAVFYVN